MTVNFLHVNGGNYFVTICFSRIATTITASRKLVRMGRKICFFVYYVKLINIKLWMAEEGVALKKGFELWTVEGRIRKGIRKNEGRFFFLHNQSQEIVDFLVWIGSCCIWFLLCL